MSKLLITTENNIEEINTITSNGGVIEIEEKPEKQKKTRLQINKSISESMVKFDDDCIQELKKGFAMGFNIKQACRYANISTSTYHNHTKDNPQLLDEFDSWRQDLGVRAKTVRSEAIDEGDLHASERYIAKEEPDVLKIEHGDSVGTAEEDIEIIEEFHSKLRSNRLKRSQEKAKEDGEI